MIPRREFITLVGSAAAWPLAARAQQSATPVVGYIDSASPGPYATFVATFQQGLKETGYVEGRNVAIEFRWAEARNDRLPALAADLVRRQVNVIVATSISAALAAKASTTAIPIIFRTGNDPVGIGLVPSLNRPSGNITGVTSLNVEVGPKRLEHLHEMLPQAMTMAVVANPTNPRSTESTSSYLQSAAGARGLKLHMLYASTEPEIDKAFKAAAQLKADGLVVAPDSFFLNRAEQFAAVAASHAIPTVYFARDFVTAGGLMSYGGSLMDAYHQAGVYVGRVLKGEKPADLPVHQATRVELVINLKTARALGLTVPPTLLARADEVIE
jgi:putative ABC transport system substrate-binding protein